MVSIEEFLVGFFDGIDKYISKEYVNGENRFVRRRKADQKSHTMFILSQRGCNNYIECNRFFTCFLKKDFETISSQAIGKQRIYLHPDVFIDMYEDFIDEFYQEIDVFSKYKGYMVCACDGSIFDLPNVKLTREEFPLGDENLLKQKRTRARASCMLDVKTNHILTSKICETTINEINLAIEHLNNMKERFNIRNLITIYDRAYASIKLMIKTTYDGSKFLIRLPKNVFNYQIERMKSNDEIIEINLTNSRLKTLEDEKLKKFASELGRLKIRIALVDIGNEEPEILATNLSENEFQTEELKKLYEERWKIETGYDRLKNLIEIENFSGIRRIIIEQDFYAQIFVYNLANTIKIAAEQIITRKPRNKETKIFYQPNFAKITGNVYLYFYNLLFKPELRSKIIKFLIKEASKELTQYREGEYENKEQNPPDVYNKHPGNKKKTH